MTPWQEEISVGLRGERLGNGIYSIHVNIPEILPGFHAEG